MVEFILQNDYLTKIETKIVDYYYRDSAFEGIVKNTQIKDYFFNVLQQKAIYTEPASDFCYTTFLKNDQIYIKEYLSFNSNYQFDDSEDVFYNVVFDFLMDELLNREVVEHLKSTHNYFEYQDLNLLIFFTDKNFQFESLDYDSEQIILSQDQQQRLYEFMRDLFMRSNSGYLHFLPTGITVSFYGGGESFYGERTSESKLRESALWIEGLDDKKTWFFNEKDLLNEDAKVLVEV